MAGTFNPTDVMMGRPSSTNSAYLWTGPGSAPKPSGGESKVVGGRPPMWGGRTQAPVSSLEQPSNTLQAESVRATGTGPFDSAYRQNLATYAGGQFSRPGGSMSFNPTDLSTFPGNPTGGGNAPVTGMPNTLMDMALGGQGFSFTPPKPAQTATPAPRYGGLQQWMDQFMRNGRGQRMGSFL